MNRIIVVEFATLDGVVEDPDGSDGASWGGWATGYLKQAVSADTFRIGNLLETAALLLGRSTWQVMSTRWPSRISDFALRMNAAPKWVATMTLTDVGAWRNSTVIKDDLAVAALRLRKERDVLVLGSISVTQTLIRHDLVDEYRLLIMPTVNGIGRRLFDADTVRRELRLISAEPAGPAAMLRYERLAPRSRH